VRTRLAMPQAVVVGFPRGLRALLDAVRTRAGTRVRFLLAAASETYPCACLGMMDPSDRAGLDAATLDPVVAVVGTAVAPAGLVAQVGDQATRLG
jgi:hypothetical protein